MKSSSMNLFKGALIFMGFLVLNSCASDDTRVLVGLNKIEKGGRIFLIIMKS